MDISDYALWTGLVGLAADRIGRVLLDYTRRRNGGNSSTAVKDNPGHGLVADQLRSLVSLGTMVLQVTERTEEHVKENARLNAESHKNLHTRIDRDGRDIGELKQISAMLQERTKQQ